MDCGVFTDCTITVPPDCWIFSDHTLIVLTVTVTKDFKDPILTSQDIAKKKKYETSVFLGNTL